MTSARPRTGDLPLVGANVKILDGANQNKAAVDAGGRYALTALTAGGFTLEVIATGYTTVNKSVTFTVSAAAGVDLTPALRVPRSGERFGRRAPT